MILRECEKASKRERARKNTAQVDTGKSLRYKMTNKPCVLTKMSL